VLLVHPFFSLSVIEINIKKKEKKKKKSKFIALQKKSFFYYLWSTHKDNLLNISFCLSHLTAAADALCSYTFRASY